MKQKKPAIATVVNLGVSFLHLSETENIEKPIEEASPKIKPIKEFFSVLPIAIIIIPIPPNHCKIALHNSIPLGVNSKFEMIVEPVVVIPDILSKKASVIDNSIVDNIKCRDPKIAILKQDKAVSLKACGRFYFLSSRSIKNILIKD